MDILYEEVHGTVWAENPQAQKNTTEMYLVYVKNIRTQLHPHP